MSDMAIQQRAKRLKEFIASLPDFGLFKPPIPYGHMGAVITDAILQAALNWESVVKPRIDKVRSYSQACITSGFRDLLHTAGPRAVLNWEHPEKLARLAGVIDFFCACRIETEEELRQWLEQEENLIRLKRLRGVGDKTADYFKFLVGIPTSAVDRHIRNFLLLAGIQTSSYDEAKEIVHCTADLMGISRSLLDHSIWKYMSSRGRKTRKPGCKASEGGKVSEISAHEGKVMLVHSFDETWSTLERKGPIALATSTGHRFRALASTSRKGKVIRFMKERGEYGRAYVCCWGFYYNCNGTRIGMYAKAVDEYLRNEGRSE